MRQLIRARVGSWLGTGLAVIACGQDAPDTGASSHALEPGTYQLQAVHSAKCLAVPGASAANGTSVEQQSCQGLASQQWKLLARPDGSYRVVVQHSRDPRLSNPAH